MITKLRTSKVRRPSIGRSALITAEMASFALLILPCVQATASPWNRALNPQPLPPGIYSPYHLGAISSQTRAPLRPYSARRVCVAWGRVCVKAGQGTRTHPAPCGQYMYVCRKYG